METTSKSIIKMFELRNEINAASIQVNIFDPDFIGEGKMLILRYLTSYLTKEENQKISQQFKKLQKFFSHENEEFIKIVKLSDDGKCKYFIDSVNELFNEFMISPIQKGIISSKTAYLGIWKDNQICLNIKEKALYLTHQEQLKMIKLDEYILHSQEKGNEHFKFELTAMKKDARYQKIILGSIHKEIANLWYNLIKNQIDNTPTTRESMSPKLNGNFPDQITQSLQILKKSQKEPTQSMSIDHPQEQLKFEEKSVQTQIKKKDNQTTRENDKQYESSNMKKEEEQKENSRPLNPCDDLVINDISQQIIQKQKLQNESSSLIVSLNLDNEENQQKLNTQYKEEDQVVIENSLKLQENKKYINTENNQNSQKEENNINQKKQSNDEKTTPRNEETFYKEEEKEEEVVVAATQQLPLVEKKKNVPSIFKEVIPIIDIEDLQNQFNYNVVYIKDSLRILQHQDNKRKFQIFMTLNTSQERVFDILGNIEHYKYWNLNLSEVKIINLMKSDNIAIIYQKNNSYGVFYKPRDFVFIRYSFYKNGVYYMIDKSIEQNQYPPNYNVVRGQIQHYFWCIQRHPDKQNDTLLFIDFQVWNGGMVNEEQDGSITLQYLKCFSNMDVFVQQLSFQQYDQKIFQNIFDLSQDITLYKTWQETKKQSLKQQDSILQNEQDDEVQHGSELIKYASKIGSIDNNKNNGENERQSEKQFDPVQLECFTSLVSDIVTIQNEQQYLEEDQQKSYEKSNSINSSIEEQKQFEEVQDSEFQNNKESQNDYVKNENIENWKNNPPEAGIPPAEFLLILMKRMDDKSLWSIPLNQIFQLGPSLNYCKDTVENSSDNNYIFKKEWRRDTQQGTMYFVNKQILQAQKSVINFLLQQMGSNLLQGLSLSRISMPVCIFQGRSNLERTAYSYTLAPYYLEKAALEEDPIEQIQLAVIFSITISLLNLNLQQPFNPILGETYQGFVSGCPIYCQQTSHHPPVCSFQLYGRGYKFEGHNEIVGELHVNSIKGTIQGQLKITFEKTQNEIFICPVPAELFNTAIGDRHFNLQGKMLIYDVQNMLIADINFNPDKQGMLSFGKPKTVSDYFLGGIYQMKENGMKKLLSEKKKYNFKGVDIQKDVERVCARIEGIWTKELKIDGKTLWTPDFPLPNLLVNQNFPLASDCNYRKDIIHRRLRDMAKSQEWKEQHEIQQRADRQFREKFEKEMEKEKQQQQ